MVGGQRSKLNKTLGFAYIQEKMYIFENPQTLFFLIRIYLPLRGFFLGFFLRKCMAKA